MNTCVNCGSAGGANSCTIQCDGCKGALHLKCVGLSESEVKMTRARSRSVKVVCISCNNNMAQFGDMKELLLSLRNDFNTSINKLREDFETQISSLRAAQAGQRLQPSENFEDVVGEVMDQLGRKNNLIVFGVGEDCGEVRSTQGADGDRTTVNNLLSVIKPSFQGTISNIQRLGRFNHSSARPRPVKITFEREADVRDFVFNSKKLKNNPVFGHVSLSFDRTPRQIELYNKLKRELNERIANGEQNIKIRYINNRPSIVRLN